MSEAKVIKCPNCGANTTNPRNCEYCGSLLVRFVDQDISLANTPYLDDTQTLPGLENAMKMNLMMQKSNPNLLVATDVYKKDLTPLANVLRTGYAVFKDGTSIPSQAKEGLCVIFDFRYYNKTFQNAYNEEQEKRHQKFRALDIFPLFSERVCRYKDREMDNCKAYEYYIDFGQDAIGASRLISKILLDVRELSLDEQLECYTNVGDNVEKSRDKIASIWDKDNNGSDWLFFIKVVAIELALTYVFYNILDLSLRWSVVISFVVTMGYIFLNVKSLKKQ